MRCDRGGQQRIGGEALGGGKAKVTKKVSWTELFRGEYGRRTTLLAVVWFLAYGALLPPSARELERRLHTRAQDPEDGWKSLRIGTVTFRVAKPCGRCVVTTRDPDTGEQPDPREPLQTLAGFHRASDGGIIFGQNLIPDATGEIAIGDTVEVLEAGASNLY